MSSHRDNDDDSSDDVMLDVPWGLKGQGFGEAYRGQVSGAQVTATKSKTWRAARQPSVDSRDAPRRKFATSRSRSAESLTSSSDSAGQSKDALKAQLAKWQAEATTKKSAEERKRARKQAEKALLDFQYCVGNMCYQAVGDFCAANNLSPAESTELMKFIRYAKEKGLITSETARAAAAKKDVKTLCKVWAENKL